MAKKTQLLNFLTCGNVNDITNSTINANDSDAQTFNQVENATTKVPEAYASDQLLAGKVVGIGNGWQKFVLENDTSIEFMVRGAAGGYCSKSAFSVNPNTGVKTGSGNIGGRGAKLKGTGSFKKGTVFYIAVGQRGPGYFNNTSTTITGGGGGASCIFIENSSGAYTFAPANKKVDVLFVAGGGAGAGSYATSTTLSGGDASYANGTATTGGTSTGASSGGAGLTGNGTKTENTACAFALLSGTPTLVAENKRRSGGWPGGGQACSGGQGAGGAGYGGGSSFGNTKAATGGTSYINPKYITPTFRGYATYADDNVNPWYVNGSITFKIGAGRDPEKCILAFDTEGYKYFDGDSLDGDNTTTPDYTWKLLPTQTIPEVNTFDTYGKTEITNASGLSGNVKFLVKSPEPEETLEIEGNINGITLVQTTPFSTSDVSLFKSFTVTGAQSNLDIRFAVSKNQGATWQTYAAGSWVDIDIKNKQEFKANGYPLAQMSAIPIEDFNAYKPATLNFAFSITQNGTNSSTILNNIKAIVDLVGSWRHYKESEATYEYVSDTKLKITFLAGGNYKVNYLDSINSNTTDSND